MAKSYKNEVLRKLIHLSSLWMLFAIWYLPYIQCLLLFVVLFIVIAVSELLRINTKFFYNAHHYFFGSMMRAHELNNKHSAFVGTFYFILAAVLAVLFLPQTTAMAAIGVLVVADSAAALIGKKFGKTKIFDKSLEGALAFLSSGFLIILAIYYCLELSISFLVSGLIAVVVTTFVELISNHIKIDDNLSIVVAMGVVMQMFSFFSYLAIN